jgi:hypothetical protein
LSTSHYYTTTLTLYFLSLSLSLSPYKLVQSAFFFFLAKSRGSKSYTTWYNTQGRVGQAGSLSVSRKYVLIVDKIVATKLRRTSMNSRRTTFVPNRCLIEPNAQGFLPQSYFVAVARRAQTELVSSRPSQSTKCGYTSCPLTQGYMKKYFTPNGI